MNASKQNSDHFLQVADVSFGVPASGPSGSPSVGWRPAAMARHKLAPHKLARWAIAAVAFCVLVMPTGMAFAAEELTGEILDMACYIGRGAKGPAHTRCAKTCADHGMPLGLLTDDSRVLLLYPKHGKEDAFAEVKALAGERAVLRGNVHDRKGLLGMEVHSARSDSGEDASAEESAEEADKEAN